MKQAIVPKQEYIQKERKYAQNAYLMQHTNKKASKLLTIGVTLSTSIL